MLVFLADQQHLLSERSGLFPSSNIYLSRHYCLCLSSFSTFALPPTPSWRVCLCCVRVCMLCVCVCVCVCVCSVHARTSPVPYGSLRMNDPPSLCPVNTHHHTFRYDASGMADGTAHPITNNRGSVTCPASGVGADFSYEGPQSCAMKPVVGDSGDSTAGCPKVFTYAPTEFLG